MVTGDLSDENTTNNIVLNVRLHYPLPINYWPTTQS